MYTYYRSVGLLMKSFYGEMEAGSLKISFYGESGSWIAENQSIIGNGIDVNNDGQRLRGTWERFPKV